MVSNIITDLSYNLNKYIQHKHVWKQLEVGCLHQHTVIALHRFDRNKELLLRFLRFFPWDILPSTNLVDPAGNSYTSLSSSFLPFFHFSSFWNLKIYFYQFFLFFSVFFSALYLVHPFILFYSSFYFLFCYLPLYLFTLLFDLPYYFLFKSAILSFLLSY